MGIQEVFFGQEDLNDGGKLKAFLLLEEKYVKKEGRLVNFSPFRKILKNVYISPPASGKLSGIFRQ